MTNRTRVFLVRHGQVKGHQEKRYNGQGEVPLTDTGRRQFELLAERLQGESLAAVYSSDLSRCLTGAHAIAHPHRLVPQGRRDLREICMGEWEGITWKELQKEYPDQWKARIADLVNYRAPAGENLLDVAARVRPVLSDIVARHQGEQIAVVGHGGINRVILLDAVGAPLQRLFSFEQDYGCLNIIDYYEDGISVVKLVNG
jgi:alpha-ribazole phosphatase